MPTRAASPSPDGPWEAVPDGVRTLTRLSYAVAGLGVLGSVIGSVQGLAPITPSTFLLALAGLAIYVALALLVQRRRNWARVALGVVAILGALVDLLSAVSVVTLVPLMTQLGWGASAYVLAGGLFAITQAVLLSLVAIHAFRADTAAWCAPRTG